MQTQQHYHNEGFQAYPAPAKINLFLHIVGRRADGYHLLQSVFRLIDLQDTIYIRIRDDGEIHRASEHPDVPETQDLTIRAAHLLKAQVNCSSVNGIWASTWRGCSFLYFWQKCLG